MKQNNFKRKILRLGCYTRAKSPHVRKAEPRISQLRGKTQVSCSDSLNIKSVNELKDWFFLEKGHTYARKSDLRPTLYASCLPCIALYIDAGCIVACSCTLDVRWLNVRKKSLSLIPSRDLCKCFLSEDDADTLHHQRAHTKNDTRVTEGINKPQTLCAARCVGQSREISSQRLCRDRRIAGPTRVHGLWTGGSDRPRRKLIAGTWSR